LLEAFVHFELVSAIAEVVTIAAGRGIRDLARLPAAWTRPLEEVQGRRCDPSEQVGACGVLSYMVRGSRSRPVEHEGVSPVHPQPRETSSPEGV